MEIKDFRDSGFTSVDLVSFLESENKTFEPSLKERLILKSDVLTIKDYIKKVLTKGKIKICIIDNKIAGLITFYANDFKNSTSYISILCVNSKYRKKGIGKSLILECINHAKKIGLNVMKVETGISNYAAIKLYNGIGFQNESKYDFSLKLQLNLKSYCNPLQTIRDTYNILFITLPTEIFMDGIDFINLLTS